MKIILAVPIYPPDIGGPAIYAQKLKNGLEKAGHSLSVVSYKGLRRFPQPVRIFLYFLKLFKTSRDCDLIYAFSLMSCGLPALLCKKKFIIRIGGDYLWERAVESGKTNLPLREYYEKLTPGFKVKIIRKILNAADRIIFTSLFQKDIYIEYFGIKENKTVVILNPFPEITIPEGKLEEVNSWQILYAGRFIKLKNLNRLIEAFKKVSSDRPILKIIGQGPEKDNIESRIKNLGLNDRVIIGKPLPHSELLKEIQKSRFCVLPSLSEITPNFALECIKLGKPILLTRETGLYEIFKEDLTFINPYDVNDIKNKIEFFLDDGNLEIYTQKISRIDKSRNWKDAIEEHAEILKIYE